MRIVGLSSIKTRVKTWATFRYSRKRFMISVNKRTGIKEHQEVSQTGDLPAVDKKERWTLLKRLFQWIARGAEKSGMGRGSCHT